MNGPFSKIFGGSSNAKNEDVVEAEGGGGLASPVADVREEDKSCGDCEASGSCVSWFARVTFRGKRDTSPAYGKAKVSDIEANSATGRKNNSCGVPSTKLRGGNAAYLYSAYSRGQRGYGVGL